MMLLLESGFAHHGMWHTVLKSCGLSGAYSQSVISHNISEMMHGPRHVDGVKKYRKAKADRITVAAAESMAG
jgi:hypothetical protein